MNLAGDQKDFTRFIEIMTKVDPGGARELQGAAGDQKPEH